MANILEVKHLNKSFGRKPVLHDISFTVQKGRIVGLAGPNGAGKSTIMKTVLGLTDFSNGEILVEGQTVTATKHTSLAHVGALIEYPGIYPFMSGLDHLKLFATDDDQKERIDEVVTELRMTKYIKRKAKSYSLGMKQKLGIALALVNHPNFVVLDEPMNGLDPESNKDLRNIITNLAKKGTTILISSHILSELEKLVDDVLVIDKGRIVSQSSMRALMNRGKKYLVIKSADDAKAKNLLMAAGYELADGDDVRILENDEQKLMPILKTYVENDIEILDIQHQQSDLETSLLTLLANDQVTE